jgi:RNA polymerase sigma-70 factor (ECF subfamily)
MYSSEWKADVHSMDSVASASDWALVSASQSGIHPAYVELCRRHSRMASRAIFRIVRNDQDTEDVLQDTLMKAFLHIGRFEGRCSFSTWLTRIAINTALMLQRTRRTRVMVSIDDDLVEVPTHYKEIVELSLDPESFYIDCESQIAIHQNIRCLPPQLRNIVELKYSDELSLREIADKAGISLGAVKSRLMRARRVLKNRIKSTVHTAGSVRIDYYKPTQNTRVLQL